MQTTISTDFKLVKRFEIDHLQTAEGSREARLSRAKPFATAKRPRAKTERPRTDSAENERLAPNTVQSAPALRVQDSLTPTPIIASMSTCARQVGGFASFVCK
jgi:hypothetical protein